MSKLSFDEDRALGLYSQGLLDYQIAGELGAKLTAVSQWRYRRGLQRNLPPLKHGTRPEVTVEVPEGLKKVRERDPAEEAYFAAVEASRLADRSAAVESVERSKANAPDLPAAPETEPAPIPEPPVPPDPAAAPEDFDRVERVVEYVRNGTDPVTVTIICRGCALRVDAACLDQVNAAGKLLAGIAELLRDVPVSDTK